MIARAGAAVAAVLVAGCARPRSEPLLDPHQAASNETDVPQARAGYVDLMLQNVMATTPRMREGQVFAIVADYGGGYVTTAALSGTPGTLDEHLTFGTVIGASAITKWMQGESYGGPSQPLCFRYTVGYYARQAMRDQIICPAGTSQSAAATVAQRQADAASTALGFAAELPGMPLPHDLATARQDVAARLNARARAGTTTGTPTASASTSPAVSATPAAPVLTAIDFAGTDTAAALSVPQPGGACIYLRFAETTGKAGSPHILSVSGWAAPVQDPCTGRAALVAGGYASSDPYAGG